MVERTAVLPGCRDDGVLGASAWADDFYDADYLADRRSAAGLQRRVLSVVRSLRDCGVLSCLHDLAPARLRISRGARLRLRAISHGAVRACAGAVRLLDAGRARGAASLLRESPHPLARAVCVDMAAAGAGLRVLPLLSVGADWLLAAVVCAGAKPHAYARSGRLRLGYRGRASRAGALWLLAVSASLRVAPRNR